MITNKAALESEGLCVTYINLHGENTSCCLHIQLQVVPNILL